MDIQFYKAFEDRFRGSRELISERLRVYTPFVQPLLEIYPQAQAIDLGSGRGEWLQLLTELGFNAVGVDLNEQMLAEAKDRGLQVHCQDAVDFLKALPNQSQTIVSAFHFVEHIPFDVLATVVKEAERVLKPGGLLILETPNPENLMVGATNFYLDPTHQRPIPAPLLAFLAEYCGFPKIKILRLQETVSLQQSTITLVDVLSGVSPDYAIVAQKACDKNISTNIDELFAKPYGISLDELAKTYHTKNMHMIRDLIHHAIRLFSKVKQWVRERKLLYRNCRGLVRCFTEVKRRRAEPDEP